jgi:hypothetical protein
MNTLHKVVFVPETQSEDTLNKTLIDNIPGRAMEKFKINVFSMLVIIKVNLSETGEFLRNIVSLFLKKTWYTPGYFINTPSRALIAVHNGKDAQAPIGTLIVTRRPVDKNEMISRTHLNSKVLQELLYHYLQERITNKNLELKRLVVTNAIEWFIFDAEEFEKHFAADRALLALFQEFVAGSLMAEDNSFFFTQVAAPSIKEKIREINYTYFNLDDYDSAFRDSGEKQDSNLIRLYKLLSPEHLLKLPSGSHSDTLYDMRNGGKIFIKKT